MSGYRSLSLDESLGRWQVWAIAAGGVVIWGAVRSGAVGGFLRFLGRHPVTTTIISADLTRRMIEPARHVVNVGSALIQMRSVLVQANQSLEAVVPLLPDIGVPGGIFESDPQEAVIGATGVMCRIGIRAALGIGRPLFQNRRSFQYLWGRWASLHSSNVSAARNARYLFGIVRSFQLSDVAMGSVIAILFIGVAEAAWTVHFGYDDPDDPYDDQPGGPGNGPAGSGGGGGGGARLLTV